MTRPEEGLLRAQLDLLTQEIRIVTAERDRLKFDNDVLEDDWKTALAERDRLREALEAIAEVSPPDGQAFIDAALSHPPQEETGRELNARLARDFDRERERRLSPPPQEGDLPESSKFIASGYGRTWDESGMIPQPPQEES